MGRLPVEVSPTERVCFGTVPERGLLDAEGRLRLDTTTDDRLLAARIVHLREHRTPDGGPDCLQRLAEEEARAWQLERAHQRLLAVDDPSSPIAALGPEPTLARIGAWLRTDADVPTALRASHQRRCVGTR